MRTELGPYAYFKGEKVWGATICDGVLKDVERREGSKADGVGSSFPSKRFQRESPAALQHGD